MKISPGKSRKQRGTEGNWERMFKVLQYFAKAHGHCDPPPSAEADSLFQWLKKQQAAAESGRLSAGQRKRLERLGVDLGEKQEAGHEPGTRAEERWEQRFAELAEFKKRHGHCGVAVSSKGLSGLAIWVHNQRAKAKAGRLRPDQQLRLQELGLNRMEADQRWDMRLAELAAYKDRFGHCDVPCHSPEVRALGAWVSTQRELRKEGRLSQERIQRLDTLGFRWLATRNRGVEPRSFQPGVSGRDQLWEAMFELLLEFKREHGHANVPQADGHASRLYKWIIRQRTAARRNLLRADRRERLDTTGFLWKAQNPQWDNWDKRFVQLVDFKKRFGHCDVPCHWRVDHSFGAWISTQRTLRNKGLLPRERIDRLDEIGFRWLGREGFKSPPGTSGALGKAWDRVWEVKFAELAGFKKKFGHCQIPTKDARWRQLFYWARNQRRHWRGGRLEEDRCRRLEGMGFEWKRTNLAWERNLSELLEYKKRFGNCEVPARWPENMVLGRWVHTQRAQKRKGAMSSERIRRLNEVGFEWGRGRWPKAPVSKQK